jgi:hypothetical protein
MTNRTTGAWSSAIPVLTDDTSVVSNIALDAFTLYGYANRTSVRVYYGSHTGNIKEIGLGGAPYPDSVWDGSARSPFSYQSDSLSGVGTTAYSNEIRAYVRNNATGLLDQWQFSYTSDGRASGWSIGEQY